MHELDNIAAELADGLENVRAGIHLLSDPELLTYGPAIVDRLSDCIAALPPMDSRSRVKAFTAEGRTPREIAGLLNVSTQAVYQHLKRIPDEA